MRRIIDRIREKVRSGQTFHAIEEMAEEGFEEEGFEKAKEFGAFALCLTRRSIRILFLRSSSTDGDAVVHRS